MAKSISELLENRHTAVLKWFEPYPALSVDGNELSANITLSASVSDCVNYQRAIDKKNRPDLAQNEEDLLLDFIAVNWAEVSERGN